MPKELKSAIESLLINPPDFLKTVTDSLEVKSPFVILFAGINGSGKTTTIAKIANYLQKNKLSVCLAAADTFRAASIEQIEFHANKLKIPLIKKDYGSDPASVGFDAVTYAAKKLGFDVETFYFTNFSHEKKDIEYYQKKCYGNENTKKLDKRKEKTENKLHRKKPLN